MTAGDARRVCEIAVRLVERPATAQAFAEGRLSIGQVKAIAACPAEVEDRLVADAAELSANQPLAARPPNHPAHGPPVEATNRALQLPIDHSTARPGWNGQHLTPYATDLLLHDLLEPVAP